MFWRRDRAFAITKRHCSAVVRDGAREPLFQCRALANSRHTLVVHDKRIVAWIVASRGLEVLGTGWPRVRFTRKSRPRFG